MTNKHTPGIYSLSAIVGDRSIMSGKKKIAIVCEAATPEEAEANKHLLRSAPELLECLEQAEKVFNAEEIDSMKPTY